MADPTATSTHECEVESLALDGRAVVRIGAQVELVPNLIPGERVRITVTEQAKKKAPSVPPRIELLSASRHRKKPVCSVQHECGGCPLMHIDSAFAFSEKVRTAKRHLRKVLHADAVSEADYREELFPAQQPLGYRTRARMLFSDRRLGYREAARRTLTQVRDTCIVLDPRLERALQLLRTTWIDGVVGKGEVHFATSVDGRAVLSVLCENSQNTAFYRATENLVGPAIAGIRLQIAGTRTQYGAPHESFLDPDGTALLAGVDGFYQGNAEINHALGRFVLQAISGPKGVTEQKILDLYAGAGNFTLPLLRRGAHVIAVESSRASVEALHANAKKEDVSKGLTAHAEKVEDFVARLSMPRNKPFSVVLDPPRAGAKGVLPLLANLGAERVVYVSCDVATLARDLEQTIGRTKTRYAIKTAAFFDMFPQTAHIETAVVLEGR